MNGGARVAVIGSVLFVFALGPAVPISASFASGRVADRLDALANELASAHAARVWDTGGDLDCRIEDELSDEDGHGTGRARVRVSRARRCRWAWNAAQLGRGIGDRAPYRLASHGLARAPTDAGCVEGAVDALVALRSVVAGTRADDVVSEVEHVLAVLAGCPAAPVDSLARARAVLDRAAVLPSPPLSGAVDAVAIATLVDRASALRYPVRSMRDSEWAARSASRASAEAERLLEASRLVHACESAGRDDCGAELQRAMHAWPGARSTALLVRSLRHSLAVGSAGLSVAKVLLDSAESPAPGRPFGIPKSAAVRVTERGLRYFELCFPLARATPDAEACVHLTGGGRAQPTSFSSPPFATAR